MSSRLLDDISVSQNTYLGAWGPVFGFFSDFESQKVRRFKKVKVKVLFRVGCDSEWVCRQESYGSVATLVLAKYGSF